MILTNHPELWLYAIAFLIISFSLDFYLEKYKLPPNCLKTAIIVSAGWIAAALIFNLSLWIYLNKTVDINLANKKSLEFFAGYLLEKSLSLDNLFVFVLIFKYFKIPNNNQRRVLNYGILGAIFFRLIMIFIGIWLIQKLHWILYVFGGLLIISGLKIFILSFWHKDESNNKIGDNFITKLCNKYLRSTKELSGEKFLIKINNKLYATPLLLALLSIEFTDIVFAIDSIPAILVILDDPFIIFTSNIFAILGLRSLYYFLALTVVKFSYLQQGVAIILIFIGVKMTFGLKLPISITLIFMSSVIAISIILSLYLPPNQKKKMN